MKQLGQAEIDGEASVKDVPKLGCQTTGMKRIHPFELDYMSVLPMYGY
jgi:hypothetical protein